ncbi:hypothetical protein KCU61_g4539, partial [Aureobasidium melanogenum]
MVCADDDLSANYLAAIRLTCKELHAAATNEFAQRYFKDPFVMMSRKSLETLARICRHPVFGPQIRKVQLLNASIHTSWLEEIAAGLAAAVDNKQIIQAKRIGDEMRWLLALIEERNGFAQSDAPLKLLKEAFNSLEGYGHPIALVAQRLSMPYLPIGMKEVLEGTKKQAHQIFAEPDMVSTLRLMLNAASSTKCLVGRIEVGIDSVKPRPRGSEWNESEYIRQSRRPAHMHGEGFHIDIKWHTVDGRENDLAPKLLPLIIENTPRNLKCFSLCSDCDPRQFEGLLLDNVSLLGWYKALEEITLKKLCLSAPQLRDFLDAHKSSLKRLILSQLILVGDWDRLLVWISQALSLEQFKLDRSYMLEQPRWNSTRYRPHDWYITGCQFRSKEEMCQGLVVFLTQQTVIRQAEKERKRREIEQQERDRSSRRSSRLFRADGRTHC